MPGYKNLNLNDDRNEGKHMAVTYGFQIFWMLVMIGIFLILLELGEDDPEA